MLFSTTAWAMNTSLLATHHPYVLFSHAAKIYIRRPSGHGIPLPPFFQKKKLSRKDEKKNPNPPSANFKLSKHKTTSFSASKNNRIHNLRARCCGLSLTTYRTTMGQARVDRTKNQQLVCHPQVFRKHAWVGHA